MTATASPLRIDRVALAGVVATTALGAAGLLGWLTPWTILAGGIYGWVPMAPGTGALFVLLGLALAVVGGLGVRWPAALAGALTAVLALLGLLSYQAGETAWLDRLFLPSLAPEWTLSTGRMSPLTAVGFVLAGVSALALAFERRVRALGDVAGAFGSLALALGLLVDLTYAYGAPLLQSSPTTPVALTTALAFTSLGTVLVALDGSRRFPLRLLQGASHGARLARAFAPLVPLALVAQVAFTAMVPVPDHALRNALLSLLLLAVVGFGVLRAAYGAGVYLDRAEAERRRAAASEARLKALFESDAVGILFADAHGRVHEANDGLLRLGGFTREEVASGMVRWSDLTPPEYLELDRKALAEARERGSCTPYERPLIRKDGEWVWVLGGFTLLGPERQDSVTFVVDISARKQAEAAQRASEQRFAALFHASPLAIGLGEFRSGLVSDVNECCASFFGYERAELIGRAVHDLDIWGDADEQRRLVARLRDERKLDAVEVRFRHRSGATRYGLLSVSLLPLEGQAPLAMAVVADITERKQLETRFLHAQKLEAVGRLAGGIAHDFNNLLGVILGHAERLRQDGDAERSGRAQQILNASERAARLTRQLLAFSRKQVLQTRVVDLGVLITDVGDLLRRMVGEDVRLVLVPGPDPVAVFADPGQLEQVLMNLCINARDAMPRGGELRITTDVLAVEHDIVDPAGWKVPAGRYARLTVTDEGTGMDAETQAHLFEPFFTTKEEGRGTGLGLSTAYGIVKQSGGFIRVSSEEGRGSRFEILLPLSESAPDPAPERPPAMATATAATVLLAEDEPALRELMAEILHGAGYRVLAAPNASEALALAAHCKDPIDLLVTDVVMPGGDGRQLARQLLEKRPGTRVLFISGYPEEIVSHEGRIDPGLSLLAKPFTTTDLLRRVHEALAGAAPAVPFV